MTLLLDFSNDPTLPEITGGPLFVHTNAKIFLTKLIFVCLMVGNIAPS